MNKERREEELVEMLILQRDMTVSCESTEGTKRFHVNYEWRKTASDQKVDASTNPNK